jgi:hypothetical protein
MAALIFLLLNLAAMQMAGKMLSVTDALTT